MPAADPEEVRRLADEVLADPVFDRPSPGLVARLRDWAFEAVGDLVSRVVDAAAGGPLGWVLVAAFTTAAIVLVVRLGWGLARDPGVARGEAVGPLRGAAEWLADAERLEAVGEWRAALRCRHRALVAALATRGLLTEVPGRTAGEYRLEVARSVPGAAAGFDRATLLFEDAWYGHRPVDAADARRFADLAEQVLAEATGRAPVGAGTDR